MATPDRRRAAPGTEEDVPLQTRLVGVSSGARPRGPDAAALAARVGPPLQPPQHWRRHPRLRRPVPLLLSAPRHLLRLRGHLLQPVPRRNAGKNAALLF